jgi:polyisoprenoid-binding protein YceI
MSQRSVTLKLLCVGLLVGLAAPVYAEDDDDDAGIQWRSVFGIVEPGNVVGSGTVQITGAGQPFQTLGGRAQLDPETGYVRFSVRGLTFAGGNNVGTTGSFTQVTGAVVCDTNGSAGGGNSVRIDTPPVPLTPAGNAKFEGTLALDAVCASEPDIAFLIVNPAGMWVAHGGNRQGGQDAAPQPANRDR